MADINYRLIAVSTLDGSTYDICEYRDFADVLRHAGAITRWDVHCFVVDTHTNKALSTLIQTGAVTDKLSS